MLIDFILYSLLHILRFFQAATLYFFYAQEKFHILRLTLRLIFHDYSRLSGRVVLYYIPPQFFLYFHGYVVISQCWYRQVRRIESRERITWRFYSWTYFTQLPIHEEIVCCRFQNFFQYSTGSSDAVSDFDCITRLDQIGLGHALNQRENIVCSLMGIIGRFKPFFAMQENLRISVCSINNANILEQNRSIIAEFVKYFLLSVFFCEVFLL